MNKERPVLKIILGGCWWFLTGILENWDIFDIIYHHGMWFYTCVPNFSSLAWLEVNQEPPIFQECWWFLTEVLEDGLILHHDIWLFTCVPNVSFLAWFEMCQEPPVLEIILGGRWKFKTGVLEDGVIFDIIDHLDRPKWSYPESFMKFWLNFAKILR